jgi:hypothetical protein
MPGSTLFMPVCDVSSSLIGLIAQFVDQRLERFAAKDGPGMNIVDDRYGFRPAGTEKWIKSGFLDERNIMPLSHLERQACYYMFSEPAVCQNMFLATEALGIGGWMHCGFLSRDVFKALGFTTVIPREQPVLANPVGLDGVFQAYCGRDASRRVLSGRIMRGVADRIDAVIWFSDLRGFTRITDSTPEQIIPRLGDPRARR